MYNYACAENGGHCLFFTWLLYMEVLPILQIIHQLPSSLVSSLSCAYGYSRIGLQMLSAEPSDGFLAQLRRGSFAAQFC